MTAQEIIEKIRALIKTQIHQEELNIASLGGRGRTMKIVTLEWVLKQLDTLQEQPVDLDDAINNWQGIEAFPEGCGITPLPKAMEIVDKTARHFYELGRQSKEQPVKKMLTAEDCPYRSSRVLHDERGEFHLCYEQGLDCECIPNGCPYLIMKNSKIKLPDIPGYVVRENAHEKERNEMLSKIDEEKIKALKEQPASEELEEELKLYCKQYYNYNYPEQEYYDSSPIMPHIIASARHFAQWQKEQMMKEAVEAIISQCPGSNEIIFHNPNSVHSWEFPWKFSAKGLNKGDKVRFIIVKED